MNEIREYVRLVLEQKRASGNSTNENKLAAIQTVLTIASMAKSLAAGESKEDDLLGEPDFAAEEEPAEIEQEASVASAVAGATVPLGANSTYPDKPRKKRNSKSTTKK